MCRAEIGHEGREEYSSFIHQGRSLWKGPMMLTRARAGNDWTMLVFFAKADQDLPALE
jgi:hypothetical protein